MPVPTLENENLTSHSSEVFNQLPNSNALYHHSQQSMTQESLTTGSENWVMVQVNAGETFTIQDDGNYNTIRGPAQVPMVLHNGAIPPILVPPGYILQVIEDEGVRRVVVLPNPQIFNMPMPHELAHSVPPSMLHPVPSFHANPYHPPGIFQTHDNCQEDGDSTGCLESSGFSGHNSLPSLTSLQPKSENTTENIQTDSHSIEKTQQLREDIHGMPPIGSSSAVHAVSVNPSHERNYQTFHANYCYNASTPAVSIANEHQHHHDISSLANVTPGMYALHPNLHVHQFSGKKETELPSHNPSPSLPSNDQLDSGASMITSMTDLLGNVSKPVVVDVKSRSAKVLYSLPMEHASEDLLKDVNDQPITFELQMCSNKKAKDGFETMYRGTSEEYTLTDLHPATEYTLRLFASLDSCKGTGSDLSTFRTSSCEPDAPLPPKLATRYKHALLLKWAAPNDNGEKITKYYLEWDKGKSGFQPLFANPQKQYKVTKLNPAQAYSFRLAAENNIGMSSWSKEVSYTTTGTVPTCPEPPRLIKATARTLTLQWQKSSPDISGYVLEMNDQANGYGFRPVFDGPDTKFTARNLDRNCHYQFRLRSYNNEGKSKWSELVSYLTCPEKPQAPRKPKVVGNVTMKSLTLSWEAPEDTGGSEITKYVCEMSQERNCPMDVVYSGLSLECVVSNLQPGHTYRFRVFCVTNGGSSMPSDVAVISTLPGPPGKCHELLLSRRPKPTCLAVKWEPPKENGGSNVTSYEATCIASSRSGQEEACEVYKGVDPECTVGSLKPNTQYEICARAINAVGCGKWSEPLTAVTSPGNPEKMNAPIATAVEPFTIRLQWPKPANNGAEITNYKIQWGSTESSMSVVEVDAILHHQFNKLSPNTVYYFSIQAVNCVGQSGASDVVSLATPPSCPDQVRNLRQSNMLQFEDANDDDEVVEVSENATVIEWDPPTDNGSKITDYKIHVTELNAEEKNAESNKQIYEVDGNVTSYSLILLNPGTMYRVKVCAVNELGSGTFSSSITLETKPLPPAAPELTCAQRTSNSLKLCWKEESLHHNSHYLLQMRDKSGRFGTVYRGSSCSYRIHRLAENSCYDFRISASSEDSKGHFSSVYTFSTPPQLPPTMEAPHVTEISSTSCEVEWSKVEPIRGDPIQYHVILDSTQEPSNRWEYDCDENRCMIKHLMPLSKYRVSVAAVRLFIPSRPTTSASSETSSESISCSPGQQVEKLRGGFSVSSVVATPPCENSAAADSAGSRPQLLPLPSGPVDTNDKPACDTRSTADDAGPVLAPPDPAATSNALNSNNFRPAFFLALYFFGAIATAVVAQYVIIG